MWAYNQTDYTNDYIAHHGILGQKWGIRRFQNDDGSLTPEGRQRYLSDNLNAQASRFEKRHKGVKVSEETKKAINEVNESRLNKDGLIKRHELKNIARKHLAADVGEKRLQNGYSVGKDLAKRILTDVGAIASGTAVAIGITKGLPIVKALGAAGVLATTAAAGVQGYRRATTRMAVDRRIHGDTFNKTGRSNLDQTAYYNRENKEINSYLRRHYG